MKTKIITLAAIGLLALLPVAFVSIGTASAGKTRSAAVTVASAKPVAPRTAVDHAKAATRKSSSKATSASSKASSKTKAQAKADNEAKPSAEQRQAKELVSDLTTTQKSKMLALLNDGDAKQLAAIKGISETRAAAIEKARPFASIDEVVLVRGIGESTFAGVIAHARSLTARRSSTKSASTSSKSSKSKSAKS